MISFRLVAENTLYRLTILIFSHLYFCSKFFPKFQIPKASSLFHISAWMSNSHDDWHIQNRIYGYFLIISPNLLLVQKFPFEQIVSFFELLRWKRNHPWPLFLWAHWICQIILLAQCSKHIQNLFTPTAISLTITPHLDSCQASQIISPLLLGLFPTQQLEGTI